MGPAVRAMAGQGMTAVSHAVLHKGSSGTAREASLALAQPSRPEPLATPDEREVRIARLTAEVEALHQELATVERRGEEELAALRAEAKETAAREFRQDDARRIELLAGVLERSLAEFEARLIAQARAVAPRLARHALERLVRLRDGEGELLGRAIERRLDDLKAQTVVSLQLAPTDWSEPLVEQIGSRLGGAVALSRDARLSAGSARIVLRQGEVTVDTAAGLARLLAAFDDGWRDEARGGDD